MNFTPFLLLALTASWTRLVQCDNNGDEEETFLVVTPKAEGEEDPDVAGSGDGRSQTTLDLGSTPNSESLEETTPTIKTDIDADTEDLNTVIMIIIPLILTFVIIAVIVCIVMIYRRRTFNGDDTKGDPYLDDEDHEKVPMPMFEDDVPSVMELEMEDLENWMAKDGGKKVDTGQI